jgi:hypothetical protein
LTLPVAPSGDGSVQPETATVVACFATEPFAPGEGTVAPPPAVDCTTSMAAKYGAGPPAVLTVDLSPFATRWAAGDANNGIALVPAPGTPSGITWHVAFSARSRTGSAVPPARTDLQYQPAAAPTTAAAPEPAIEAPVDNAVTGDSGLTGLVGGLVIPPPPASAAAPIVGQSRLPAVIRRPRLAAQVGGPGFAYPGLLAAPLLLLALGSYLGWALTRPVAPPQG